MIRMAQLAFSGSFDHSLDGKGRVIIPASFREALGEDFTITINPNKTAIAIYPKEMWDKQLEVLSQINPMDRVGMQYQRFLLRKQHGRAGPRACAGKAAQQDRSCARYCVRGSESLYRDLGRRGLCEDGSADRGGVREPGGLCIREVFCIIQAIFSGAQGAWKAQANDGGQFMISAVTA